MQLINAVVVSLHNPMIEDKILNHDHYDKIKQTRDTLSLINNIKQTGI